MASEFIPISTGSLTLKANFFSLADGNVWNGSSFVDPHLSALAAIAGWRTALSEIKDSSDAVTVGYELAIPAGITIPIRIAVYTSDAVATETWGGEYDPRLDTISGYVDCLPATWVTVPTAIENADALLARNVSNVEATAAEHTLCTIILAGLESAISGTTWTIYRTNGSTTHATKTVTASASADPITGVA